MHDQDTFPSSRFRGLCRTLGLSLFYHKLFHRSKDDAIREPTKVAIRGDRTAAMLGSLIHFIPVGVAVSISSVNWFGVYIGGELAGKSGMDQEKLAGLLFAAKLHELTITASLAAVLFFYIRHEIALEKGVPFGAVFAGRQFQNVSFFWSQEFWGTVRARYHIRRKRLLLSIISLCTLLGVSVGPSSANILKPRQGLWSAGGTKFFINASATDLWPTMLDGSWVPKSCNLDTEDPSCPSGNWQVLGQNYLAYFPELNADIYAGTLPETTRIAGRKSVRELYTRSRGPYDLYANSFTVATTQSSVIADALSEAGRLWTIAAKNIKGSRWRFEYRLDAYYKVTARQPLVRTRCIEYSVSQFNNPGNYLLFYSLSDTGTYRSKGEFPVEAYVNETALERVQLAFESSVPQLLWFALPEAEYGNATIGAAITYPQKDPTQTPVYYCTVDARWAPVLMQGSRDNMKVVTGAPNNGYFYGPFDDAWPKITIAPEWASFLNPEIPHENSNVFLKMLQAAGLWNSTNAFQSHSTWATIESLLAVMIANGLGRLNWNNSLVGDLVSGEQEWMREMMPRKTYSMGPGGSVFVKPPASSGPTSNFTMSAQVSGWAYSAEGAAAKASIFVLLLYSLIVIVHVIHVIYTGESSSSWTSIAEIAALAMNSKQTDALRNTGAGIETPAIYERRVRVVALGDHLELDFDTEPGQDVTDVPRKDSYYG